MEGEVTEFQQVEADDALGEAPTWKYRCQSGAGRAGSWQLLGFWNR